MTLSDRQVRMLQFIRSYLEEHSYPPTIREIGKAVGIPSTSVVKYNLERLQEKGYIERSEEVSRGLRLDGRPKLGVPPPAVRFLGSSTFPFWARFPPASPLQPFGQQDNPYAGEMLA